MVAAASLHTRLGKRRNALALMVLPETTVSTNVPLTVKIMVGATQMRLRSGANAAIATKVSTKSYE